MHAPATPLRAWCWRQLAKQQGVTMRVSRCDFAVRCCWRYHGAQSADACVWRARTHARDAHKQAPACALPDTGGVARSGAAREMHVSEARLCRSRIFGALSSEVPSCTSYKRTARSLVRSYCELCSYDARPSEDNWRRMLRMAW